MSRRDLPRLVPDTRYSVKRVVLLFVSVVIGVSLTSQSAEAQRSGSLQVSARVIDTRESWSGFESARAAVTALVQRRQPGATVETSLANVSIRMPSVAGTLDRPRTASITINYLRN